MRLSRRALGDLGLGALGVGALALTVLVVSGAGRSSPRQTVLAPLPGPTVTAPPSPSPSPVPAVRTLLLGDELTEGLAPALEQVVRWDVTAAAVQNTGFVTGEPGQRFLPRLTTALRDGSYDVVVLAATTSDGNGRRARTIGADAAAAAALVRSTAPQARLVVVAPVAVAEGAFGLQRSALTEVTARFGGFYVDPVGDRWLVDRPGLFLPGTDQPNAAGYAEMAQRLVQDLQGRFPGPLLPPVG